MGPADARPNEEASMSSLGSLSSLWKRRELLWNLTRREVHGRYRGSLLGWSWSILNPLLMLSVYTFVFSQIFTGHWDTGPSAGPWSMALNLFAGLVTFNIFGECAAKSPSLVVANPNYVKKVIFPLELLGATTVGAAFFHGLTGLGVLAVFQLIQTHSTPPTILLTPLVWAPLLLGCLATSWVLSALGVFIRDTSQVVGVLVSMMMFLSAVFYPAEALPERYRSILELNPLVSVIEQTRRVAIEGFPPSSDYLITGLILGAISCEISYRLFQKTKRAFADVL